MGQHGNKFMKKKKQNRKLNTWERNSVYQEKNLKWKKYSCYFQGSVNNNFTCGDDIINP